MGTTKGRARGAGVLVVLVLVAVVAALGGRPGHEKPGSTSPTPTPATRTTAEPPTTGDGPARSPGAAVASVDRLVVAAPAEDLAPYRRAMFGDGWDYDPASGCNTRERVLITESLVPAAVDDRCRPSLGRWRSVYDGVTTTDPAGVEIDHLVPLADVWRAGGAAWTPLRREAYANDLTDPNTLIAVTSHTNRSKSDSTPDQWLPPDRSAWCTYASAWVEVKVRWHLTVTPAEKATLVQIVGGC